MGMDPKNEETLNGALDALSIINLNPKDNSYIATLIGCTKAFCHEIQDVALALEKVADSINNH